MSAEKAQKLVQGGIKAVRDGKPDLAKKAFTQALKLDPNNEGAWLGMATITDDTKGKLRILKKILGINPNNERAKEALRRLAADQKKAAEPPPQAASSLFTADVEETSSSSFSSASSTADDWDMPPMPGDDALAMPPMPGDDDLGLPPMPGDDALGLPPMPGDDDLGLPPMPGDDDLGLPPMPGEIAAASVSSKPSSGLSSLKSLRDTASQEIPAVEEEPEIIQFKTSAEAFAQAPQPSTQGDSGTPLVDEASLDQISAETLESVQTFLEEALADYLTPEYSWIKKKRGRAGETEYPIFLGQVAAAIVAFIFIVGFGLVMYVQSNPAAQLIIFGASPTPTFTFTPSPTTTPGFTNTPSQTPNVPATLTPDLDPIVTPGNPDQYFPPEPTDIYYPNPLLGTTGLTDAVQLMREGRMEEAFDLIEAERTGTELSGDFPPVFHLSEWYIINGDLAMAREVIEIWEDEWEDTGTRVWTNAQPLYLTALARVDIAEARIALGNGLLSESSAFLATAERQLNQVLGIGDDNFVMDSQNALTHILLAQRFALDGEDDIALEVLNNALSDRDAELYGDTNIRLEKARILVDIARYDEALQELSYIVYLDPFLEDALILQVEAALSSGQAGLAVLYGQQYLLYYPGSVQGFWLLGQAREAENKFDLAIAAYSQGLNGDVTDENYTSDPFFLPMLTRRSELYTVQGAADLASQDVTLALELADNSPAIRAQRMEAAYARGDYDSVLEDAEELLDLGGVPRVQILFTQGRAYIDQGENYRDGLDALSQAINAGLAAESHAIAQEYIARGNYELGNYGDALEAIEIAIADEDTGSRRYLRGLIYEGRGDFTSALLDYEYVLTWGQIYPYPFFADAQERYDDMIRRLGNR